jgi:zinc transporter 9
MSMKSKMRLVTIVGAGLLVGTALAVIIPEGVHTLYKNGKFIQMHTSIVDLCLSFYSTCFEDLKTSHGHQDVHKRHIIEDNVVPLQKRSDEKKLIGLSENAKIQNKLVDSNGNQVDAHNHAIHGDHDQNETEKHEHGSDSHSSIGLTLVLGFIFMLIVDQIGGKLHHTTCE